MKIDSRYILRSLIVWGITILLSGLFLLIPFEISDYVGYNNKIPTEPFDVYAQFTVNKRTKIDPNIVIIDIPDNADRDYLARTLENLYLVKPAVVGLDIYFKSRKDSVVDARLINAISQFGDSIVLGMKIEDNKLLRSFFADSISVYEAHCAADVQNRYGVIRTFIPEMTFDDKIVPHMSYMLSSLYPNSKYDGSRKADERVYIYYWDKDTSDIRIINADSVLNRKQFIEGKIALVGKYSLESDIHRTSISSNYPGIRNIADETRNMIHNKFIWHNSILDIVVCALILLICSFIIQWYENGDEKRGDRTDIACLILQVVLLIFVIIKLGYKLYLSGIYIDFSLLLLWIIFMPIVNDFYKVVPQYVKWLKNIFKKSKNLKMKKYEKI